MKAHNCGATHHFIAADNCRFHLASFVGEYLISTVGDYHPPTLTPTRAPEKEAQTIGAARLYETMVFRTSGMKPGAATCPQVTDWGHIDFDGYNDPDAANRGHAALVRKWKKAGR